MDNAVVDTYHVGMLWDTAVLHAHGDKRNSEVGRRRSIYDGGPHRRWAINHGAGGQRVAVVGQRR